ncbi:MAG: hypothetical protein J0M04_21940 [Verrucomicrobia bacterium]|nr:hypothetical protein [Verrucomicrobiota bacterium]
MQLTRFDRWLRRRFVYETHIQTLRMPSSVPEKIRTVELPEVPGKRYRFLFVIRDDRLAETFARQLKEENLMFSTAVVDRTGWHVKWVAPADRSVFWTIAWTFAGCIAGFFAVRYIYGLATNPEVVEMFRDAYKTLTQ